MTEAILSRLETEVNAISERVSRHEDRLEIAVRGMSDKLDDLVKVSHQMATLQERQSQHADGLADLKLELKSQRAEHAETLKRLIDSHDKTASRLHDRVDNADKRIGEAISSFSDALASHCKQDASIHDDSDRSVTKMRHDWELKHASYEKDQLQQSAQFTAALNALEKRFDAFLNHIEGMKKLGYALWSVIGVGVLAIGATLVKFAFSQIGQ